MYLWVLYETMLMLEDYQRCVNKESFSDEIIEADEDLLNEISEAQCSKSQELAELRISYTAAENCGRQSTYAPKDCAEPEQQCKVAAKHVEHQLLLNGKYNVVLNGNSLNLIVETVNAELQLLSTCLKSNRLSLNSTKTYYAVFHRAKMKLPMNSIKLIMDKNNLREVECIKYLGVILDNKLLWIQHISYVKNNISKGIGIMYKARNYIYINSPCLVSFVYISLLYFCIASWGNASNCHLDPLFVLQKRILGILTLFSYDVPSESLLNILIFYLYISWFIIELGL